MRTLARALPLVFATLAGCKKDAAPAPSASASAPLSAAASTELRDAGPPKILRLRARSEAHVATAPIHYVAWDPTGRTLATTCGPACPPAYPRGGGVGLWSFPELEPMGGLDGTGKDPDDGSEGGPMAPLFVAGGRRLVAGSMFHVFTWSLSDSRRIGDDELGAVEGNVLASPDGTSFLAMTTFGVLALFDAETGQSRLEYTARRSEAARLSEVRWSRDGNVAITADELGPVDLWDVRAGKRRSIVDYKKAAGVAISPDGDRFALALPDGRVQLFRLPQAEAGRLLSRSAAATSPDGTAGAVFSPDGKLLAVNTSGQIRVWDLDHGDSEPALTAQGTADPWLLRFNMSGQLLVWGTPKGFAVWDRRAGTPPRSLGTPGVGATAWMGPASLLVGTEHGSELWDVAAETRRWRYDRVALVQDQIASSPDGRWLALADGDLHLVRIADGGALTLRSYAGDRRGTLALDEQTGSFDGDEARAREDLVESDGAPLEASRRRDPGLAKRVLSR